MAVKDATILKLKRIASPEEAGSVIGDLVEAKRPSFNNEVIAYDEDTGELVAAVINLPLNQNVIDARYAVQRMAFAKMNRANNYGSDSKTFGWAPRRPVLGREGCTYSATARDTPDIEDALERLADECYNILEEFAPDIIRQDREATAQVLDEWRIGHGKLWTSGVVNDTARLPYHRDNFNFPAYSAMPVFRHKAKGGYLHLPEYGVCLPCRDSTVAYFKGKELVHGVTPITPTEPGGYRYSIVYYALRGMKDCLTHAKELEYAQRRRSERELDMARRIAAGDTTIPGYRFKNEPNDPESCAEAAGNANAKRAE